METMNKRLDNVMREIQTIYVDSIDKRQLEKKLESYKKGSVLISEAMDLIKRMQNEISNLTETDIDNLQESRIDEFIDLLSSDDVNFDEVLYIINQLFAIRSKQPVITEVFDNINNDVKIG